MTFGRVTVTLPADLLLEIDHREKNRSRFIAEAVRHELERRRRLELQRSLDNPHAETADLADLGFAEWAGSLPPEEEDLVNLDAGTPVRWVPGQGWVEGHE